jgi:plasmid stability protein
MRRTQIQLDDATYEAVRRRAYERGRSMSSVVRDTLSEAFGTADQARDRKRSIDDFTFVGMGVDPHPPEDVPVSVDHDKWLAEAIASRWEKSDAP